MPYKRSRLNVKDQGHIGAELAAGWKKIRLSRRRLC